MEHNDNLVDESTAAPVDGNLLDVDAPPSIVPTDDEQLMKAAGASLTDEANPYNMTALIDQNRPSWLEEAKLVIGDKSKPVAERIKYAETFAESWEKPTQMQSQLALINSGLQQDGSLEMELSEIEADKAATQENIDSWMMWALNENRPDDESLAGMMGGVASEVFDPLSMQGIVSVAQAVGIQTDAWDRMAPGEILNRIRERADVLTKGGDVQALKEFWVAAGGAIKDTAALAKLPGVGDAGGLNQWLLADYIFSDRDSAFTGKTATNIYNVIDVLSLGLSGAVRKSVTGAIRLISPSTATSKAASSLGKSATGTEKLIKAANSEDGDAVLAKVGTDPASVINDHVVPKHGDVDYLDQNPLKPGERKVSEQPYYESTYFSKGERAAAKENAFVSSPSLQLNQSWIDDVEGGFDYTGTYFASNGRPFRTMKDAKSAMDVTGVDFEIVKLRKGAWAATTKGSHDYSAVSDTATVIMGERAGGITSAILGKNIGHSQRLIHTSDTAVRITEKHGAKLRDMLVPYARLSGADAKAVDSVLDQGDRAGIQYTRSELLSKGLSNKKQLAGYRAAMQVSKEAWEERNALAYASRKERGHVSASGMVKGKAQAFSGALVDVASVPVNKVLDSSTGMMVDIKSIAPEKSIINVSEGIEYWSKGEQKRKATYVAVDTVRRLDRVQVVQRSGHINRTWNAPAYVIAHVKTTVDGVEKVIRKAVGTAPSRSQAAKRAAQMNEGTLPDGVLKYDFKDANEYSGADTLAKLEELGMTRSSRRDDDLLWDTHGDVRMDTVTDSLNRMIQTAANQRGLGRWTETMIARLRNTTKDETLVGKSGELNINWVPSSEGFTKENSRKVKAIYDYVLRVNGLDKPTLNVHMAHMRDNMADFFYDIGAAVRYSGDGDSSVSKALARPITGMGKLIHTGGDPAIAFAKSSTYLLALVLNPVRQRIMQATMAPTYLAAKGAGRYAMSGEWLAHQTALALNMSDIPAARKMANQLGVGGKDFDKIVEGWKELGYDAMVAGHMFSFGTVADGRIASRSRAGLAAEKVVEKIKRYGIDAGVTTDYRAAYLVSLNRWKMEHGKRFPRNREEWQEVGSFSSQLAMNMNRSDTLLSQKGWTSVALQFMAHQFKMSGRIMSGVTAALPGKASKILAEEGFTRAERLRLGAYQGLMYGGAGYGVANFSGMLEEQTGVAIPAEVKLAIDEGAVGYMGSKMFEMAVSPDDPVDFAFSETLAPANFVAGMVGAMMSGSAVTDGLHLTLDNIPATGMGKRFFESMQMGASMVGLPVYSQEITNAEAWLAGATKVAQAIPFVNNIVRGMALVNTGQVVDSTGTPVMEAAGGAGLIRALTGIQTRDEKALQAVQEEFMGKYQATSEDGRVGALKEQAEGDWRWIESVVTGSKGNSEWDLTSSMKLIQDRADFMARSLGPVYAEYYREVLQRKAEDLFTDNTKAAKLRDNVQRWLDNGNIMATQDLVDYIRNVPQFDGKDEIVKSVEHYFNAYDGPKKDQ